VIVGGPVGGSPAGGSPPQGGASALTRRTDRRTALALVVLALAVYNLNFRVIQDGDTVSARLLPFALWRTGSLSLDAVAELAATVPPGKPYHEAYYLWRSPAGHLYTKYPVVTPVMLAPLYAPAVAYVAWQGWEQWRLQNTALRMEKLAASLVAALSVGLFYLLARRKAERPRALLAAVAYGFATTTWVISSQALWLHGMGELLAVVALLAATAPPRPWSLLAAGLAAGLLAGNRPPDAALGAVVLVYLLVRHGRRAIWALGAAAAALAPILLYNFTVFRHWAGGYGVAGLAGPHPFYSHPLLPGIAGLLLNPAKGLLVFSPFLAFLAVRMVPAARMVPAGRMAPARDEASARSDRLLDLAAAAAFLVQLCFYARTDFRAGSCYGPGYLTDALPFLVWLLVPVVARLRGWGLRAFVLAVAVGIAIQAVGAFCYPRGRSDDLYYPRDLDRLVIAPAVWSPANAPFLVEARAGVAPPELLPHRHSRR
jgi:hypothetical protein